MNSARICLLAGAALMVAAAALGLARSETAAQETDWTAKATETWSRTCQKCHTAPDATFETDRAFLRQITETS